MSDQVRKANEEILKPYRLMEPHEIIHPGDLYYLNEILLAEPSGAYGKTVGDTGRPMIELGCKLEFYSLRSKLFPEPILTPEELVEIFHD